MEKVKINDPLNIDQIDFRIQSINKGGYATILAYKDARVDMNRLDEVFGVFGWQKKFEVIGGNLFCSVGVYDDVRGWVWKCDVGTESNTEKEKGQASDAFKRACFNLGIGRELYDYPAISIKLLQNDAKDIKGEWYIENDKPKQGWGLKLKEWVWFSQFNDGKLNYLACKDNLGNKRFEFGTYKNLK